MDTPAAEVSIESVAPSRFAEHCEDEFKFLAVHEPLHLLKLIEAELAHRPELLTFAAEAAGAIEWMPAVVRVLLPLLEHPEAVVREGALYGLMPHLERSIEARDAIRQIASEDPSQAVREVAADALAQLD